MAMVMARVALASLSAKRSQKERGLRARYGVPIRMSDIAAVSLIASALWAAITISSRQFSICAFATIWLFLLASIVLGRLALVSLKIDAGPGIRLSAEFITGHVIIGISMMLLCLSFKISAGAAYVVV